METPKVLNNRTYYMRSIIKSSLPLGIFLFFLLGTNQAKAKSSIGNFYNQTDSFEMVLYSLPSPEEIISYVNYGQLKYSPGIMQKTIRTDRYVNSKDQSIAIGIYLADLAYTIVFEQSRASLDYLKAIDDLGKSQNIFPPMSKKFRDRFIKNLDNIDSLSALSAEIYEMAMDNLYETSRHNTYAVISSGCVIESLYLVMNSYDKTVSSTQLVKKISDQKLVLDQLIEMIEAHVDDRSKLVIMADLKPVIEAFNSLTGGKSSATVKNRYDGVVIIGGKSNVIKSNVAYDALREAINEVRNKWIK